MTANKQPGKIVTFYSYKGGTGRSMMLANAASILASNGKRVLTVDWDLEAPGLHRYFSPFLVDKEITSSNGIIDFTIDFVVETVTPNTNSTKVSKDWYKSYSSNILRYAMSLDWQFPDGGALDFIPAGKQGPSYSSRVNSFNWQNFYDRSGGGVFLEAAKEIMRQEYDYILIDSRTGVSDTSGICTVQMPDYLVVCFTLNNQSIEGAAAVAASIQKQRGEFGIRIFPVPARVELAEKERLDRAREYTRQQFGPLLWHILKDEQDLYWGQVEIVYQPFYAYEEILATFGDKPGQTNSLLVSMERLTAYLTERRISRSQELDDAERQRVIELYTRKPTLAKPDGQPQESLPDSLRAGNRLTRLGRFVFISYSSVDAQDLAITLTMRYKLSCTNPRLA